MDPFTIIGLTFIGFVSILTVFFKLGLIRKAKSYQISTEGAATDYRELPDALPGLIKRHLRSIYERDTIPDANTACVWGTARYKVSGIWMPVRYKTTILPGQAFLRSMEFFWYRTVILKGIDFFKDGAGSIRVNGVIRMNESGEKITESQWVSFWAECLLLGLWDLKDERLIWEETGEEDVTVYLPEYRIDKPARSLKLRVRFHPENGRIQYILGERFRGQIARTPTPWMLTVHKWIRQETGWMPVYSLRWGDQKKPWCRYTVDGILRNMSLDDNYRKLDVSKFHQVSRQKIKRSK